MDQNEELFWEIYKEWTVGKTDKLDHLSKCLPLIDLLVEMGCPIIANHLRVGRCGFGNDCCVTMGLKRKLSPYKLEAELKG